jgi:hypothetical protein
LGGARTADRRDPVPPEELTVADGSTKVRRVLDWYDFVCAFCHVSQQRKSTLEDHGFELVAIPLQAHPEIPPGGRTIGARDGCSVDGVGRASLKRSSSHLEDRDAPRMCHPTA